MCERSCVRRCALLLACAGVLAGHCATRTFLENGRLVLGANYWSSFNATKMWRDWRPDEIEKDFVALKEHGMTVLRVFPTWSDFQPIVEIHANSARWNRSKDTRMTLGERIREGFADSLDEFGWFLEDLVIFLAAILPWLIIPAVIVLVLCLILRRRKRKKLAKAGKEE